MAILYDEEQLQAMKKNIIRMSDSDGKRRAYIQRLQLIGSIRSLVQTPTISALDKLDHEMSNFSEVTAYVRGQVALRKMAPRGERNMELTPILLQGPPGIGKTRYAQRLAEVLKVDFHDIAFATTSAAFVLKGTNTQWSEGQVGRIFEILADSEHMNPLVLLDEVDKAISSNYPPINALYELLEPNQAARFQDEAMTPITLNASHIMWVITANEPALIPEAIISRCRVFDVPMPSSEQVSDIAQNVYRELLAGQPWRKKFAATLSADATKKLSTMSARDIRKVINEALGVAAINGHREIKIDAVNSKQPVKKFGF